MKHSFLTLLPSRQKQRQTLLKFCGGALLGALVFLLLYGPSTLNCSYDSWIRQGYVEEDIIQHYAAWQFYRNASWQFPLTWLDNAAVPLGAAAAWADPLPWAALFFKLLSPLLPPTFQYFGLITFLHFVLQGGFAWLLIDLIDQRYGICISGTLLFCLWPTFLERCFRHVALSAHWLILWMLYLYISGRRRQALPAISWVLLFGLIPGIHAYFLPMAFGLLCASALEYVIRQRNFWKPCGLVALCMAVALCCARSLGVIMPHSSGGVSGDYGSFSMNLNALFNPSSMDLYTDSGKLDWSLALPLLPQNRRQYDGFNYLGFGVLLALTVLLFFGAVRLLSGRTPHRLAAVGRFLWSHIGLLIACTAFTVFAVTHTVYWNDHLLFQPPVLPQSLQGILDIFRASGRMFWPVGYLLALCCITAFSRLFPANGPYRKPLAILAVSTLLLIQLADMSGLLLHKAAHFRRDDLPTQTIFTSEKAQQLFAGTDTLCCMGNLFDYHLAEGVIHANPSIQTDLVFFARGNFNETFQRHADNYAYIVSGQPIDENALYAASERSVCEEVLAAADENVVAWQIGRFYFFGIATEDRPLPDFT